MSRFGIEEKMAEVLNEMDDFFVIHGIEDTFELRVNRDGVAQKVKMSFDLIPEEIQKFLDDVPEEIREELQSMVDGYDIPTFDSFQAKFKDQLKTDVYITLRSLTVTADKLDLEGGYDELVKISKNDIVTGLTSDQKIDEHLEITRRHVALDILEAATNEAMDRHLKAMFGGGIPLPFGFGGPMPFGLGAPTPSDTEESDDSEGAIAGFQSLLDAFNGICGDSDNPTGEDAEDEEEDPEFGGDVDLPGIGGFLF